MLPIHPIGSHEEAEAVVMELSRACWVFKLVVVDGNGAQWEWLHSTTGRHIAGAATTENKAVAMIWALEQVRPYA